MTQLFSAFPDARRRRVRHLRTRLVQTLARAEQEPVRVRRNPTRESRFAPLSPDPARARFADPSTSVRARQDACRLS
jgi:hypothetical protein